MSANQPTNNTTPDWRDLRRQERAQRRAERGSGAWLIAVALIGVGILLTLQNVYGMAIHNWWALFILLPAVGCLAAAWRVFRQDGGALTLRLLAPLGIGLVLLATTAVFLLDLSLNWGLVVPALLIVLGVIVLLTSFFRRG